MQVDVHAARTQLSTLIEAALAGEDVVIWRDSRPVVRLVPVRAGSFDFDPLAGRLTGEPPDFFEPLPDDEMDLWEGG